MRTRKTRAISLGMYLMFSAGVALWLIKKGKPPALPGDRPRGRLHTPCAHGA